MLLEKIKTGTTTISSVRQLNNNFDLIDRSINEVKDLIVAYDTKHTNTEKDLLLSFQDLENDVIEFEDNLTKRVDDFEGTITEQVSSIRELTDTLQQDVNNITEVSDDEINNLF